METSHTAPAPSPAAHPPPAAADPTRVTGRRFGAYLIDAVVLGAIVPIAIFFAVARPTIYTDSPGCTFLEGRELVPSGQSCVEVSGSGGLEGTWVMPSSGYIAAALYLVVYLVAIAWLLQGATGKTIGKILFGIRTVDGQGVGPGIGRQLVRGVLWIVDGITCLLPIAAWSILLSKRNQRVGDLVAGTFVVRSSARGAPIVDAPSGGASPPPGLDPSGVVPGGFPTSPPTDASAHPPNAPIIAPAPAAMAPPQDLTTVHVPGSEPTVTQPAAVASPSDDDATVAEGWTPPPPAEPTSPPVPEQSAPEAPGEQPAPAATGGPQWDPDRNAYIQWDPARQTWLVYDDDAAEWKPIS